MRYLTGAFLGAMLMVAPAVVCAQDAAEPTPAQIRAAAEAFDSGRTAYKEEQYQAAAEQFERADANAPSPAALEFALRARDKAGNPDRAATLAALAQARHPDNEALQKLAGELLERHKPELYELRVLCSEPCDLTADSKIVHGSKALERTIYLVPGQHAIVADFGDGRTATQAADAEAGQGGELSFQPPAQVADNPTPETTPVVETPPEEEQQRKKPSGGGWSPAVFWTGAALTAAVGGFTIWSGIDTINDPGADHVRELCAPDPNSTECQTAYNEGRDKQTRTNIAIGATAGLGVATIVIGAFLTDWGGGKAEAGQVGRTRSRNVLRDMRVSPWLGAGSGGLGASGRF